MDFKRLIRKIVVIFASPEFAFIYCIIGTLAQVSHTYYLVDSISSLDGWTKHLQAFMLSLFISSSLLFFTAIADDTQDTKDSRRILLAVNLFMVIEILINVYYYAAHLMLKTDAPNWFDFIFAILISCLIPVTIKLYAGVIKAREWFETQSDEVTNVNNDKVETDISNVKEIETKQESEVPSIFNKNKTQAIRIQK